MTRLADPAAAPALSGGDLLDAATGIVRASVGLPAGARIVAAMSGGVDSSVTAALLARAGYEVVGVTLQLYDHGAAVKRAGACCAGQDVRDARAVADRLGVAHYVLDYESRFREAVIDDFADAYLRGETPIPCVRCNQTVKFRDLLEVARDLGAEAMATGHYVRRREGLRGVEMLRGADPARDQSYFLFATTREQLEYLRFPLGDLPKSLVREVAAAAGLAVARKPDSQDICFVPEGNYATLIDRLRPHAAGAGEVVHVDGRVLGRHEGVTRYTIGQRRGLGVAVGEPLFVTAVDAERKRVIVGPREALAVESLRLREVNWLGDADLGVAAEEMPLSAKVRSNGDVEAAHLVRTAPGWRVGFARPQFGVAPGQACVLYDGDRLLGGGFIDATQRAGDRTGSAAPVT